MNDGQVNLHIHAVVKGEKVKMYSIGTQTK